MKTKYNMTKIDKGAIRFVFVTRGRSKPFSQNEIDDFFNSNVEPISIKKNTFRLSDNRNHRVMFMNDLKRGLDFCSEKYGVTQEEIVAEANRVGLYTNFGG